MHMVIMNSLTLHFTKGKVEMFPISQDILRDLHITEPEKVRSKGRLHFNWRFHGNTICCNHGYLLTSLLLFSKVFSIKTHKTAQVQPS